MRLLVIRVLLGLVPENREEKKMYAWCNMVWKEKGQKHSRHIHLIMGVNQESPVCAGKSLQVRGLFYI